MKVEKIKNRLFYNLGIIIILFGLLYVLINHRNGAVLEDYLSFLFFAGTSLFAGARSFYFDRYLRIIRQKPIVDLWLFLYETKFEWLMFTYFFIRPVFGQKENQNLEKTRRKINIYASCAYIFLTGLILFLIIK